MLTAQGREGQERITFNPGDYASLKTLLQPNNSGLQSSSNSIVVEEKSKEISVDFHNILNQQPRGSDEHSFNISAITKDGSYVAIQNPNLSVSDASFLLGRSGIYANSKTPFFDAQGAKVENSKLTMPTFRLDDPHLGDVAAELH